MRSNNGFQLTGVDAVLEAGSRAQVREGFSYYSGFSAARIPNSTADRRRFVVINRLKNADGQMENEILESTSRFSSSDTEKFVGIINSTTEAMGSDALTYQKWAEQKNLGDQSDSNADPDLDGRVNLLEFFSGSDPLVGDVAPLEVRQAGGSIIEVRYTQAVGIGGVTATVETTTDLQNWTHMNPFNTTEAPGEITKGVTASFSSDEPEIYVRLKVEMKQ